MSESSEPRIEPAREMFARDRASQALGMEIVACGAGFATVEMTVREDMMQGHATCHGGFLFALADSAFAFACNSHGGQVVAAGCSIEYLAPVGCGERLSAHATEQARVGRGGVYDVAVRKQSGELVALFRGRSRAIG